MGTDRQTDNQKGQVRKMELQRQRKGDPLPDVTLALRRHYISGLAFASPMFCSQTDSNRSVKHIFEPILRERRTFQVVSCLRKKVHLQTLVSTSQIHLHQAASFHTHNIVSACSSHSKH
jgi:hypothetical protein